jgi:4-amino-4-deoxy-L-arabinose transferase-like glycosyltransferase
MRSALAVACVAWSLTFARGLARRLLPPGGRDATTLAVATAGFGAGLVTLLVFWGLIVWPGGPVIPLSVAATFLLWTGAATIGRPARPHVRRDERGSALSPMERVLVSAIVLCCTAIVFNAVYWPFEIGDALALYAPFGRHIYETATLPSGDRLHEAYPMLVPIAYALTHWAAGSVNEYVARLVPALMAIAAVAAGGVLARAMGSRATGLLAAALIALTPVFGRWASTGYTDVPAALYVGLTGIFIWQWWESGASRPLLLAGLSAGLAMWTKNSTLTLLPSLLALVLSRRLFRPVTGHAWISWQDLAAVLAPICAVAGPWYLRNLLVFGFFVPPTIFVDSARHTPAALTLMLQRDQHFGLSGWIFTGAVVYGVGCLLRRGRRADGWYVLLALLTPFAAAWWWLASYESRFLVTMIPVFGAMGALMLMDLGRLLVARSRPPILRLASAVAIVVVVAGTAAALRKTIEHKTVLVRTPWLGDAERHRVRVGGLYDLAVALNRVPEGSRVAGVPSMARYYLDRRRFAKIEFAPRREPPGALASEYDYVVYRELPDLPVLTGSSLPMLRTDDGYLLYATREPALASADTRVRLR